MILVQERAGHLWQESPHRQRHEITTMRWWEGPVASVHHSRLEPRTQGAARATSRTCEVLASKTLPSCQLSLCLAAAEAGAT